jgi:hypothetical protein
MTAKTIKPKLALSLLTALLALCGCAHQYLVKLTNGDIVAAATKPKLVGTNYYFRDISGQDDLVPRSRVAKISAGKFVEEEQRPPASKPFKPKKQKHWYFLWLA